MHFELILKICGRPRFFSCLHLDRRPVAPAGLVCNGASVLFLMSVTPLSVDCLRVELFLVLISLTGLTTFLTFISEVTLFQVKRHKLVFAYSLRSESHEHEPLWLRCSPWIHVSLYTFLGCCVLLILHTEFPIESICPFLPHTTPRLPSPCPLLLGTTVLLSVYCLSFHMCERLWSWWMRLDSEAPHTLVRCISGVSVCVQILWHVGQKTKEGRPRG